jgi:uncharacterized protein with PQ loop repeat
VFVQILGWIAALVGACVSLPQVIRLLRVRTTAGVSELTWQLVFGVNLAWITHGVITHHANIVVHNALFASCTSTILILVHRDRGTGLWKLFSPGILVAGLMVSVDVLAGPVAFAVTAFLPAAVSQLAQLRSLVVSHSIHGVSLMWLACNVINQAIWFTWSVLVHEVSVTLVAIGMGTLMTVNLILGTLRRLQFVRPRLSLSDG